MNATLQHLGANTYAREALPADAAFLRRLFDESAMALPGVSAEVASSLADMQFRGRELTYMAQYPGAKDYILCLADGTSVGRHLVVRQPDAYRTIDLAVLGAHQRQGHASAALAHLRQQAGSEGVSVRLCVANTNPALLLYQRRGFLVVASDELSFEMECRPARQRSAIAGTPSERQEYVSLNNGSRLDRNDVLQQIIGFLREIGLKVELTSVEKGSSFLPGIQMVSGGLQVDADALLYPGDLLHEAGHLAVMPSGHRLASSPVTSDAAEEMGALAWSYAAAVHLGIPPEVVFHEGGYRGQAAGLMRDFARGMGPGVPFLWWIGMTTQPLPDRPSLYPRMLRWLREELVETVTEHAPSVVARSDSAERELYARGAVHG